MSADLHDQVHSYAVGALSSEESAEFATHLETCESCRREVAAMSDVTAALSDSVAADPPASLRASVLAEIARTAQEPPLPHESVSEEAAGRAGRSDAEVVPLRRRSATTWATSLVAAAAVLAAIAFGGLWWQERQDADDAATQAEQLTAVLTADDVRTVTGASDSANHTGTIVMSREEGKAYFVSSQLADLSGDQVYEAWTISGAEAAPAGTFTPSTSDTVVALPAASLDAEQMAITVEPSGGSDSPTSDPVVTFTMPPA